MKTNSFSVAVLAGSMTCAALFALPGFSQDQQKPASKDDEDSKQVAAKIEKALSKLPKADRYLADAQRYCPMMDKMRLGAMGLPVKITIDDKPAFLCCAGCEDDAKAAGKKTLATVEKLKKATAAFAKLPVADLPLAEAHLFCPIQKESRLGSMGPPVKVMLDGKPVFLCCKACDGTARKDPKSTLSKVDEIKKANAKAASGDD